MFRYIRFEFANFNLTSYWFSVNNCHCGFMKIPKESKLLLSYYLPYKVEGLKASGLLLLGFPDVMLYPKVHLWRNDYKEDLQLVLKVLLLVPVDGKYKKVRYLTDSLLQKLLLSLLVWWHSSPGCYCCISGRLLYFRCMAGSLWGKIPCGVAIAYNSYRIRCIIDYNG